MPKMPTAPSQSVEASVIVPRLRTENARCFINESEVMARPFRSLLVLFGLFLSLIVAIEATRGGERRLPLPEEHQRKKTRPTNSKYASPDLISIELDTTDENEYVFCQQLLP